MISKGKLRLRKIVSDDVGVLLQWENNPENHKYSETPNYYSREMMQDFVDSVHDIFVNNQLRLMIEWDGCVVGCIDLFDFDPYHLRAGVGVLIDTEFRNKGIAKESLLLLEVYAFKNLNINNLHCIISVENLVSIALFKSCGYSLSGELKSWLKTKNNFSDVFYFQKLHR